MKRIVIGIAAGVVLMAASFMPILLLSQHPRHQRPWIGFCCVLEPLSNAQELHARIDTRAMCKDRHGSVIEVDGLYTDCITP